MKQIMAKPIIPQDIATQAQIFLADGVDIEAARFENIQQQNVTAKSMSIDGVIFDTFEISSSKLRKSSITDTQFNNCMLFATDFDGSGWQRVELIKGMMSGMVLTDTSLKDVFFKDVKINLSNFRFSKLERVKFEDCDLTEADFQEAEMKNVDFTGCDLLRADFSKCKMSNVDLRSSQLHEIKGIQGLKGAIISSAQLFELAQDLAAELGIRISDD